MNERIRKLADECNILQWDHDSRTYELRGDIETLDAFAELIIKECMALMKEEQEYYSKPPRYESREYYEFCRAKVDAFEDAARIIKNHFGVEE